MLSENKNKMTEHKLFRINQDAIIKNNKGEILILKRQGKYLLPGGRLEEEDKTLLEGLKREIKKETGIKDFVVEKILNVGLSESKNTYRITFLGKVKKDTEVILSDEHEEYAWVTLGSLDNYEFEFDAIKNLVRSNL